MVQDVPVTPAEALCRNLSYARSPSADAAALIAACRRYLAERTPAARAALEAAYRHYMAELKRDALTGVLSVLSALLALVETPLGMPDFLHDLEHPPYQVHPPPYLICNIPTAAPNAPGC